MPMEVGKINCATIAASDLALKHVERTINPVGVPLKSMRAALVPLFGIQWNKQVIFGLTTNRFNNILKKLRQRGLDQTTYDKMTALWQDALPFPQLNRRNGYYGFRSSKGFAYRAAFPGIPSTKPYHFYTKRVTPHRETWPFYRPRFSKPLSQASTALQNPVPYGRLLGRFPQNAPGETTHT